MGASYTDACHFKHLHMPGKMTACTGYYQMPAKKLYLMLALQTLLTACIAYCLQRRFTLQTESVLTACDGLCQASA